MRHLLNTGCVLALLLIPCLAVGATPGASASKPATTTAARDGWPDTPAGAAGRGWVQAYASGDSAMRAFYQSAFDPDSLAKRSADQRLTRYHTMRDEYGKLVLGAVVKSTPSVLNVTLIDAEAASHEFVFTTSSKPPYKLLSVGMMQKMQHGFGGFHH